MEMSSQFTHAQTSNMYALSSGYHLGIVANDIWNRLSALLCSLLPTLSRVLLVHYSTFSSHHTSAKPTDPSDKATPSQPAAACGKLNSRWWRLILPSLVLLPR